MYIDIYCSNCGAHRRISNKKVEYITNAIEQGWGSFGDVTYCPRCTATWEERNGYDRPLADDKHTFMLIMDKFMREIRYREEAAKRED